MDESTIIIIIGAVAGLVIVALLYVAYRKRRVAEDERLREEAGQHRDIAAVTAAEARRAELEAEEKAAQARRQQLEADQSQLEAARIRREEQSIRARADELDPDVDDDGRREVDLREADAGSTRGPEDRRRRA